MKKHFIVYEPKSYTSYHVSQNIKDYTDTGENEPKGNTDTTYRKRVILEYDVTFSKTGKTVKSIRCTPVSITRYEDGSENGYSHDYVTHYEQRQELEGKSAKELYKRLMEPRTRPFEVTYAGGKFCDVVERSEDCINASYWRDANAYFTIVLNK